jgi:hypothetical protein
MVKFMRVSSAIVALALLASGCRVVGRIQEGQKVSMDPCKLIGLDKAQSVMGAPMYQQLNVPINEDGQPSFGGCSYQFSGSYEWTNLQVEVSDTTRSTIRGANLPKSLRNLGREARYEYDKPDSPDFHGRLFLAALTDKGALLELMLWLKGGDEPSLLSKARSLAGPAIARMEKVFPGNETPPNDPPPIPVCSVVGSEGMIEIYKSFWSPPNGKSILLSEQLSIGGPEGPGAGPVGGGWLCDTDMSPHDGFHPHTVWWINRANPPAEPLPGSVRVPRLGAAASSRVVDQGWYFGGRAFMLSVLTKGGRHFEVEVFLDEVVNEAAAKSVATAVAQKILSRLP